MSASGAVATVPVASHRMPIGPSLRAMDLPPLNLSLLGGFELRCGTDTVPIQSGRIRSLLAWLALHSDAPQPRLRVACALWPESREGQARTNLRNLIHQLRRTFSEIDRYLETGGAALLWRPGTPVSVDVSEFERALAGVRRLGRGREARASLESALALYTGPLLPDRYDDWLSAERGRVGRLYQAGLEALLDCHIEAGDFDRAREASERILDDDGLNERAHRARIRALAAMGDRAGAVRAYKECESLLAVELGVGPSEATLDAYGVALATDSAAESAATSDPVGAVAAPAVETPLVGRSRERAALQAAWARALDSAPRMAWVTGEPGIGKTRLAQSFAAWVRRQGDRVVEARAYPTHGALAYGPVIEWLRSPVLALALAAASPATRSELRRLLPELGPDEVPDAPKLTEAERRQRLHDAVIAALSSADGPSVLIIDDLQWSDQETIDLLNTLVLRSPRPALIVATVRTGEAGPDHPLARIGAGLEAADRLERIELQPLSLEETAELVRSLLEPAVTDRDVRVLHRETEGNPLFIVETSRIGPPWAGTNDIASPRSSPAPRIRAVIEARLGLLSDEGRLVTRVAAVIGREFTLALLLTASPLDREATLRGLEEAWRGVLVRERGDGRYDFSHGKIQEVAYRTTSPIRRRGYHLRLAEALEASLAEGTAGPEATLDQVALHYDRGGSVPSAVEWYRRAARSAMDVSGLDAVRQLLGRALELVERLPQGAARDELELEMRLSLGSVLVALEGYGRARTVETYERARELCVGLHRPTTLPILRALALASLARGDLDAGSELGRELARSADRDEDDPGRVEGAYVSGVMAFWRGDLEASRRHLTDAIRMYRPDRHREHVLLYAQDPKVVCLSRLAWTQWLGGRVSDAWALRDEAIALAERQADPMSIAYALWFTAFIAVDQGDGDRLADQAGRMKSIATTHRLLYSETVADGLLGYLDAVRGDPHWGITRMRETLADRRWLGMEYVLKSQTLFLIARAAASAGDPGGARATVREGLAYLGPGPSIWKPQLQQIDARLAGQEDRTGELALRAFRDALEAARDYGAAWTELNVALDHARWTLERKPGDAAPARQELERAIVPYRNAPPLTAVAAARVLLERLAPNQEGGP